MERRKKLSRKKTADRVGRTRRDTVHSQPSPTLSEIPAGWYEASISDVKTDKPEYWTVTFELNSDQGIISIQHFFGCQAGSNYKLLALVKEAGAYNAGTGTVDLDRLKSLTYKTKYGLKYNNRPGLIDFSIFDPGEDDHLEDDADCGDDENEELYDDDVELIFDDEDDD